MAKLFTQDEEALNKAKSAKTVEELITLTKEDGIELSEAEVKKYFDLLQDDVEISDEDLSNVSGGAIDLSYFPLVPNPCRRCGANDVHLIGPRAIMCAKCFYKQVM